MFAERDPPPRAATSLKLQSSALRPGRERWTVTPAPLRVTAAFNATASRGQVSVTVRAPPAGTTVCALTELGTTALAACAEAGSAAMTTRIEKRMANLRAIRHATTG
jgi:hypothetical protein